MQGVVCVLALLAATPVHGSDRGWLPRGSQEEDVVQYRARVCWELVGELRKAAKQLMSTPGSDAALEGLRRSACQLFVPDAPTGLTPRERGGAEVAATLEADPPEGGAPDMMDALAFAGALSELAACVRDYLAMGEKNACPAVDAMRFYVRSLAEQAQYGYEVKEDLLRLLAPIQKRDGALYDQLYTLARDCAAEAWFLDSQG